MSETDCTEMTCPQHGEANRSRAATPDACGAVSEYGDVCMHPSGHGPLYVAGGTADHGAPATGMGEGGFYWSERKPGSRPITIADLIANDEQDAELHREHTLTKDCWCNPTVEHVPGRSS